MQNLTQRDPLLFYSEPRDQGQTLMPLKPGSGMGKNQTFLLTKASILGKARFADDSGRFGS